jgi:prepilin-type N-terminal cleavage/methylation domain-containing protein
MSRSRLRADDGFTLVELLVAMLILGILTAIGLSSFLGQRGKAQDANAKTAVVTASKAMAAYSTDTGAFTGADPAVLVRIEPSLGQAHNLTVDASPTAFTVSVDSLAGGAFSLTHTTAGDETRDCTQPGTGACRDSADARGNRW